MSIKGLKYPVDKDHTVAWTEEQRILASKAAELTSVEDLVAKVSQPIHLQAFSNLNHVDDNHGSSQEP
jgi:hypothetical protein